MTVYAVYEETDPNPIETGTLLISFRGEEFTYYGCYHPRKVTVYDKSGQLRDYYANVFGLGIMDAEDATWTFYPEWNPIDSSAKAPLIPLFTPHGVIPL